MLLTVAFGDVMSGPEWSEDPPSAKTASISFNRFCEGEASEKSDDSCIEDAFLFIVLTGVDARAWDVTGLSVPINCVAGRSSAQPLTIQDP